LRAEVPTVHEKIRPRRSAVGLACAFLLAPWWLSHATAQPPLPAKRKVVVFELSVAVTRLVTAAGG
jgi:hypothetical protein